MPILIPNGAICYRKNHLHEPMTYHVGIADKILFEEFCKQNNIGHKPTSREDVIKSDSHVYTKNSWIFENFPQNTSIELFNGETI